MKKQILKEQYINKIISESINDYLVEEGKMQNFGKSVWNGMNNAYYGMKHFYQGFQDFRKMMKGDTNMTSAWGIRAFIPEIVRYGKKINQCLLGMNIDLDKNGKCFTNFLQACNTLIQLLSGNLKPNMDFSTQMKIIDTFRQNAQEGIQQGGNQGFFRGKYNVKTTNQYFLKFSQLVNQFEYQTNHVFGLGNYAAKNTTLKQIAKNNGLTEAQLDNILKNMVKNQQYPQITNLQMAWEYITNNPSNLANYRKQTGDNGNN